MWEAFPSLGDQLVAFSRIEKIPGTRRVQISEVRRIWRFDRLPEASGDDAS